MVLNEGKTKIIRDHPTRADLVVIESKDSITAGDGARKNVIVGKGKLATHTTCNVFRYLMACGMDTAFVDQVDAVTFSARRCTMVPLEVVTRRLATGSYLKRRSDIAEGFRFDTPLVEFFLKDDLQHDPLITKEDIVKYKIVNSVELEQMVAEARRCFLALETAWQRQAVSLVDLKVEFGRHGNGSLIMADVIDNDSWRIWPQGDKSQMKDKQVYRNLKEVTDEALEAVLQNYTWVAIATDRFVTDRGVTA